jgi:hypothetical protein
MVVMYTFADLNMANYPPPNTTLQAACQAIQADMTASNPWSALSGLLQTYASDSVLEQRGLRRRGLPLALPRAATGQCYNLTTQLPGGANATISAGDWSGVGTGTDGANWDFETCTFLVEVRPATRPCICHCADPVGPCGAHYVLQAIGTNGVTDMFLPRAWSLDWLTAHCQSRFGVSPQPRALADLWGFDRLQDLPTSHIVFTNGLKDGWSVGGVSEPIPSKDIFVYNLKNGAHHSDLSHMPPGPQDTPDVQAAHADFAKLLKSWLGNRSS